MGTLTPVNDGVITTKSNVQVIKGFFPDVTMTELKTLSKEERDQLASWIVEEQVS